MKSKTLTYITAMTVFAAQLTSIRLVAQDQEEHHKKHTHYLVKDLGTLGGTAGVALIDVNNQEHGRYFRVGGGHPRTLFSGCKWIEKSNQEGS
jgi:hypothetical protein